MEFFELTYKEGNKEFNQKFRFTIWSARRLQRLHVKFTGKLCDKKFDNLEQMYNYFKEIIK